jgi:hypothetical protein
MGLTIHYTLHAPDAAHDRAQTLVSSLRQFAVSQGFPGISELILNPPDDSDPFPFEFPVVVGEQLAMVPQIPAALFSFTFGGSDSGIFALARLDLASAEKIPGKLCKQFASGHHFHSFCKTQFASISPEGSTENFLRAHKAIVAVLDHARSLGIEVEVHDESEYWEHRDEAKLLACVSRMNNLIAAFTGAVKDRHLAVQSPILGSPDFERMEAAGQDMLKHRPEIHIIKNPEQPM